MKQIVYIGFLICFGFSSTIIKIRKVKFIANHSNLNKGKIDLIVKICYDTYSTHFGSIAFTHVF